MRTRLARFLPFLMIWTNSYERLTWTPILVLIALELESPVALAYAASAYSAANLVGNILFGSLSDKYGRFKVAGIALLGLVATTLFHLRAWSVLAFVGIRFFHGFFAAAVAPSTLAAASDGVSPGQRGQMMARMGLMIAIASIVASPLAGRLVQHLQVPATLRIQALFLFVVGMLGALSRPLLGVKEIRSGQMDGQTEKGLGLSEGLPEAGARSKRDRFVSSIRKLFQEQGVFHLRVTLFACMVGFAVMFGQNILFYALPLKAATLNFGPAVIGSLFGIFAIGAAVAFMPPFSRLADRFGRVRPIQIGCSAAAIGLFFLGRGTASGALTLMSASLLIYGFGFGLAFPAVSAATADGAESSHRGMAYGLLTATFSVGSIMGPLVAQALDPWMSPFTVGAIVMVSGLSSVLIARGVPALHGVSDISTNAP